MAEEMYFLYLDGVQRGPYTVSQIGHMVNSGIVHPDALFWCEGLDQWQPVAQLITPKEEIQKRRIRLSFGVILYLGVGVLILLSVYPSLKQGWREQHQVEKTAQGAYWRARGVLREHLGWFSSVSFADYQSPDVRFHGEGDALVDLHLERVTAGKPAHWKVRVHYDDRLKMWVPAENAEIQP